MPIQLVAANGIEVYDLADEDITLPFNLCYCSTSESNVERRTLAIHDAEKVCPVFLDSKGKILTPLPWSKIWYAMHAYEKFGEMSTSDINEIKFLDRRFD